MPISPSLEPTQESGGPSAAGKAAIPDAAHDETTAPDSGHGRGELIDASEQEEVQPQRHLKSPEMPSKTEIAEHRASGHLPYRNWCPDCIEVFGREWQHVAHPGGRTTPLISCDYLFITPKGIFLRKEISDEERERALTVLVA